MTHDVDLAIGLLDAIEGDADLEPPRVCAERGALPWFVTQRVTRGAQLRKSGA